MDNDAPAEARKKNMRNEQDYQRLLFSCVKYDRKRESKVKEEQKLLAYDKSYFIMIMVIKELSVS
jgi:hypothetical protein